MAKIAYDCHITAICSGRNANYVKSLGADVVIDYTSQDVSQTLLEQHAGDKQSDLLVDCVGGRELLSTYVSIAVPNDAES